VFLLDTNVVSELRKVASGRADPAVSAWERGVSAVELFLSVVTLFEIEIGVRRLELRDPRQGRVLRRWFSEVLSPAFADRVLAIDEAVALSAAAMHLPDRRSDRDAFIAATALVYGLTVVTRNVRDFQGLGVKLANPWE
jgi:predicted nucleic acid-binding protein